LRSSDVWRKILGYSIGERLRLTKTYVHPKVEKGEIGRIVSFWFAHDYLGYCFTLKFSHNRELVVFSDEVEEI